MIEIFLIKPFLALLLITVSCSILGIFVLWKKLAYFGEGLSHSIILGIILGAFFNSGQIITLSLFAIIFALLVEISSWNKIFSKSTLIAICSYFCIAIALILNDLLHVKMSLNSYIFGDILIVENNDLLALSVLSLISLLYYKLAFRKVLLININQDLARIEGIKINLWNLSFAILLALTIAFSVRIVGVFLMTALLILPAATARIFSKSATTMAIISLSFGIVISAASFKIADIFDLAANSTVIALFCLTFFASLTFKKLLKNA